MMEIGKPHPKVVYAWEGQVAELQAEIERLRAALWPFAMKALKGATVCADDYRRAGEAMPFVPDHVNQQKGDKP